MPQRYDASMRTPQDAYERERAGQYVLLPRGAIRKPDGPLPLGRRRSRPRGHGRGGTGGSLRGQGGADRARLHRRRMPQHRLRAVEDPHPHVAAVRRNARRETAMAHGVPDDIRVDFAAVMQRVRRIRAHISRDDSVRRLATAGVDVFLRRSALHGKQRADRRRRNAALRQGADRDRRAAAHTASIPGLAEAGYLTNENVFDLTELPRRLLVIGGGPLGCELAQAFCRLGAKTTIAQDMPLFLPQGGTRRGADSVRCVRARRHRGPSQYERGRRATGRWRRKSRRSASATTTGTRSPSMRSSPAAGRSAERRGSESGNSGRRLRRRSAAFVSTTSCAPSNPRISTRAGDVCLEHKFTDTADRFGAHRGAERTVCAAASG